eukprot:gene5587-3996_t
MTLGELKLQDQETLALDIRWEEQDAAFIEFHPLDLVLDVQLMEIVATDTSVVLSETLDRDAGWSSVIVPAIGHAPPEINVATTRSDRPSLYGLHQTLQQRYPKLRHTSYYIASYDTKRLVTAEDAVAISRQWHAGRLYQHLAKVFPQLGERESREDASAKSKATTTTSLSPSLVKGTTKRTKRMVRQASRLAANLSDSSSSEDSADEDEDEDEDEDDGPCAPDAVIDDNERPPAAAGAAATSTPTKAAVQEPSFPSSETELRFDIAKAFTTGPPVTLKTALKLKWNECFPFHVADHAQWPTVDKTPLMLRDGSVLVVRNRADFARAQARVKASKEEAAECPEPAAAAAENSTGGGDVVVEGGGGGAVPVVAGKGLSAKAWRKAPWPDYVPPEARQSSGSVSGSREPSRPSTPARRDRNVTEHDAPSHVDVHTAGGHANDDKHLDTRELSPPRTRSRANSHDSRTGGGNRAGPGPSTWETNSRVHGFILGPPPTAPGNPSAVVDDSATIITQLSMGTGGYTQSNKVENKRKTAASNPSLSKMLPVPIRIVNHESEWVNKGAYFTAFVQGEEEEQPDGNHELFEQQLQGKRPIVSTSSAAGKSQRSDSVNKRDTDTVFPTKRLPLAEPLARYGQTGGAVTYGTLNIRRNCSLAEVLAAARQQFDLEDISDVTLVKHQRYSRETVSYSMSMRTLPDPPPIDDDCTLIFYLGGTLAQSENIHDGAAAFLYHQAHPHGPPPLLSSASIHQSGPPSASSLTATRRAVAAAAISSPSSSRRRNRQSPSNSPHHPSSPSRNRREGGGTATMAMDDRLFVETLEEEARAYNAFVNATAATFATSALSSRRPSSSHLHDLIDASSAQAMTTAEQQPQQWQSVRNVHDLQRRHRFSEPTHQHPGNLEAQTSTSFRWSPSAASRGLSHDPRDDAQQPQPQQYDDNKDDPAADDDHSAHGFQDARLASTYDAWDRRPAPPSSKTRPTDYPPMPYAFQDPYEPEPPSRGGPNNVSALTLPRFPSYVTAYESEPAAVSVSRGGGGYAASPSSSAAAMRPKISEFDFMAVAKPSAASASSSHSAAAPMASVSSVRMGVQEEAPSSSSYGRPARETPSKTASAGTAAEAATAAGPSADGGRMTTTELDDAPAAAAAANTQRSSDEEKTHDEEKQPPRGHSATTATTAAPAIRAPEALGDDGAVAGEEEEEADRARATHTKAKGSWVDPELARLERRYLKSLHLKPSSLCAKSNSAVALAATPMVHVTPTKTRPPPPPLSPSTTRSWANHRLRPTATTTTMVTTAGEAASTTSGSRSRSTTPTGGRHHRDFQHPPAKEKPLSSSMQQSESAHRQRMAALREKQAAHVDPGDSAFAGYRNRGPGRSTSAAPHQSSPSYQQASAADDESSVVSVVTTNSHGTATSRSSSVREMFLDFRNMARKTTLH